MLCASNMFGVVVSAILLSTLTGVQSRYEVNSEIYRHIVHKNVLELEEGKRVAANSCNGYTKLSGSYYKLHDRATWNNGQQMCVAEGGSLAIIKDEQEAQIVKAFASGLGDWTWVNIGVRDFDGNGNWRSVLGDPLDKIYHSWSITRSDYHCGALNFQGDLEDVDCMAAIPFICEKQC